MMKGGVEVIIEIGDFWMKIGRILAGQGENII